MREIDDLRRLTLQIREPALAEIVATARRRRRSALAWGTATGAAALALAGVLLATGVDRAEPPPRPTSPAERVVRAGGSQLVATSASRVDTDTRVALWQHRGRAALVLTDDGFASSTILTSPVRMHVRPEDPEDAPTRGPRIEALPDGDFLLVDTEALQEWIVGLDGDVTEVSRSYSTIAPADPGLWFKCRPRHQPGSWAYAVPPIDPVHMFPWCALDLASATAYEWPTAWHGSVSLPVEGVAPWGATNRWQPTVAWWESERGRSREVLHDSPAVGRGPVWGAGEPTFFVADNATGELRILVPAADGGLASVERPYPEDDEPLRLSTLIVAPDGGLLAVESFPQVRIWRADALTAGEFILVHRGPTSTPAQVSWPHEPVVADDHIDLWSAWGLFRSEDEGHTWSEVTSWR